VKKKKWIIGLLAVSLSCSSVVFAQGFTDTQGHWAKTTIEWGQSKGYITGYPDGSFKPNNQVTEAEILTMLLSSMEAPVDKEEKSGHWADPYYRFADKMNYPTNGLNHLDLRNSKISRVRVAELVSSTQGVHYNGDNAIKYLLVNGLAKGKSSSTVEGFGGSDLLTRAEAIAFIQNVKQEGLGELKERPATLTDPTQLDKEYKEMVKQQPTPEPTAWTPGDVRVLADQLFPSYKDNGESVTVTIPKIDGYSFGAAYYTSGLKATHPQYKSIYPEPGKNYTFKKGEGGLLTVAIQGKSGSNVEAYTISIDDGMVNDIKDKDVPIQAVLKGLGVNHP